ncbi:glycosyltransferase family protein [Sutcliffiella horikoshii]|uniref:Glycosyltransferase n=1 Tax=Sutcliffiella horikoshii TaxID=79883 RepID=A0AA94WS12_9BACI|nr:glycosyltransferase [Sutcliffiella horikoshii]TYS61122.1 glycosyltransferase [Sutcliffiella horikoshii]
MKKKPKILVLIKPFNKTMPKHKAKYDMITAMEKYAEVKYWHKNGHIKTILKSLNFKPDFILHYDIAWNYALAPMINGLGSISIPKGCVVIDIHFNRKIRKDYFKNNKIDVIFSLTKSSFLKAFPTFKKKFKWWPFAINPSVFKDYKVKKNYDFLLMGQVYDHQKNSRTKTITPIGKYPFRDEVLLKMRKVPGFVHRPHPGHHAKMNSLVNANYAKEISKAHIFFTCGSRYKYPVLKYFEIPACRTLMLAEPVPDILELGFKDGENFVACNRDNFYEKAMYYLKNENERELIRDNGYKFIHEKHTISVRALEITSYIEELLKTNKNK